MGDKKFRITLKIQAFSNVTPFVRASSSRCFSKDRISFVFKIKRPLLRELDSEDEGSTISRKVVRHLPEDPASYPGRLELSSLRTSNVA
jgi:hypothetical protein